MKRALIAFGTASVLAFSVAALADNELSLAQLDGVTAGGNAAADAYADAFGVNTTSNTSTFAEVLSLGNVAGQVGYIEKIKATAVAASDAAADGQAMAMGAASGVANGTGLADSYSYSRSLADNPGLVARQNNYNNTMASTILRGHTASSSSMAGSAAALANSLPTAQ